MENEEKKEEGKSCGCACGKSSCCCKAFGAVGILVIGLIGGYFAGKHCTMCAMKSAPAEVSAPATPAAPAPVAAPAKKK